MKVGACSPFAQVYDTLFSWLCVVAQKIQAIWQKILGNSPSFQYAFSQQGNNDCHLQMWVNFHRLQELRAEHPTKQLVLRDANFKTCRQWLAEAFVHFQKWVAARNGQQLNTYFTDALQQAPCAPELFTPKGKRYSSESWNPIERGERRIFSPAFLDQVESDDLSYTLPIFEEEGSYFCYHQETRQYELIQFRSLEKGLSPANLILSNGQRASLPPHFDSLKLIKLPGKKTRFIQAIDPALAVGERFVPRHLGTYKLLLLNLGLDASHEAITNEHPDASIVTELQTGMDKEKTPWSSEYCKKEYLIEHALATLFQQDQKLAAKVQQYVDFFFRTWGRYEQDLWQFRNGKGCLFTKRAIDRYLPGKEQMLAYCLMKNIQFLWVCSMSSTAFCRHMGLPKIAQWLPFVPGPSQYRKAAYQKMEGHNFIEIWKEVSTKIQEAFPQQKDWVSFSGHGMLFSFDSDLIQQQNQRSIDDLSLAEDLGVAGIDSLYGKEMDVFYRRKAPLP